MDRQTVAAAMQAAGFTLDDPHSPNVLIGRSGGKQVHAALARRGWRLQDSPRYPLCAGIYRKPEQVAEFCTRVLTRAPVEEAPCFFDGEMVIRLDQVGGCA